MKRILTLLLICFGISTGAFAQTEVKTKPISTVPQRVHNTFSKHKHHVGYKTKVKSKHHTRKHKHYFSGKKDIIKQD